MAVMADASSARDSAQALLFAEEEDFSGLSQSLANSPNAKVCAKRHMRNTFQSRIAR
jgi:hypothetical protein